VLADAIRRERDDVFGLLAEVDRRVGHAPVAQARTVVLPVELPVERIAGVALRRRPHLTGDLRMARDRGDRGVRDEIRAEQVDLGIDERFGLVQQGDVRARARVPLGALRAERLRRDADLAPAHEGGIGEEVREPVALERALEAGLVRALGEPDPGRLESGEALRRGEPDPQLRFDRTIVEQREIPVRGAGGEDLHLAGAREVGERADDVAPEAIGERELQAGV